MRLTYTRLSSERSSGCLVKDDNQPGETVYVTPQIPGCLIDHPLTYGISVSHIMKHVYE